MVLSDWTRAFILHLNTRVLISFPSIDGHFCNLCQVLSDESPNNINTGKDEWLRIKTLVIQSYRLNIINIFFIFWGT